MTKEEHRALRKELQIKAKETRLVWASISQGPFVDANKARRKFSNLWLRRHNTGSPSRSKAETDFRATLIVDRI